MPDNRPPPLPIGRSPRVHSWNKPGVGLSDTEARVDMRVLHAGRLERVRAQLRARDCAGCLL